MKFPILTLAIVSYLIAFMTFPIVIMKDNELVDRSILIQAEANRSLGVLVDCETAYRGYLLTHDKEFLQPLSSKNLVFPIIDHLKTIVQKDEQKQDVSDMGAIAHKVLDLAVTVSKDKKQPMLPVMYRGKQLVDDYRGKITDIKMRQGLILRDHQTLLEGSRIVALWWVMCFGMVLIILLIWTHMQHTEKEQKKLK